MVQWVVLSQKLRLFALETFLNSIEYGADIFIRPPKQKIIYIRGECDVELVVSKHTRLIQSLLEANAYKPWLQGVLPVLRRRCATIHWS